MSLTVEGYSSDAVLTGKNKKQAFPTDGKVFIQNVGEGQLEEDSYLGESKHVKEKNSFPFLLLAPIFFIYYTKSLKLSQKEVYVSFYM